MAHKFSTSYIEDSVALFHFYKKMAEGAIQQVTDEQLFATLDEEMNSIAIIVKHMTGNMRSRWTDFLTSDGEKPDRNRDMEFVEPSATREELLKRWNEGWDSVFHALDPLSDSDLERKVTIRGEPHSVMQAVNRQIALRVSLRTNCVSGEALQGQRMEIAQCASKQVRGIQPESVGRRGQPEIVSGEKNGIRAPSYQLAGPGSA